METRRFPQQREFRSLEKTCQTYSTPAGCPSCEESAKSRREKIFDTACELLQSHSYLDLSMDKLARRAGMSKKTLYQLFARKEALLTELMQERLFKTLKLEPLPDSFPLADQLIDFMQQLYRQCIHPQNLALLRLLIGESERSPIVETTLSELIRLADQRNPLHAWLLTKKKQGLLAFENLEDTADRLFGLVLGSPFIDHLLNYLHKHENPSRINNFIKEGVRVFLAGYGVQQAKKI